ncbi:TonB-linked SusC/RagA family outer membrane protein [Filimonas zeae]|nr:SusC/RagA family TonB-linked outer membrane protein [Filimonas zeae]MDR6339473.1 TonB-linked SusC/RagA family outer membrane protein [Filimonas zeae]
MNIYKLMYRLLLCSFFFCATLAHGQDTVPVSGTIKDSTGQPVAGASIHVKNKTNGVNSGEDGSFRLQAANGSTLVISAVGYATQEVAVTGATPLLLVLKRQAAQLEEVVVTALGVKRAKRNLTYSTQEVKSDEILATKEANLVNTLAGKVSGMQVTSSSGAAGASSRVVIRGNISATGNNQALFVVDGIPINNDETSNIGGGAAGAGSNRAIDIDPNTIDNVNVLKGAAATALYGSAGANGVILITTKNGTAEKKPVITFTSDYSVGKAILPQRQRIWAQGTGGVFYNGEDQKTGQSWGPRMDTLKINGQPAVTYHPEDLFLRTAKTTQNALSVNGGNSNSSYFLSYSYLNQQGLQPKNEFKRHSIFAKYSAKIGKHFNSTFQLAYSNSNQNRLPEGASNGPLFVILVQPVSWNPYPVLASNGTPRMYRLGRNSPLWSLDNINNNSRVNRFLPVMTLNYTPTSWLTVTERVGADIFMEQDKYVEQASPAIGLPGQVRDQTILFRQFNHDFMVSANKQAGRFNMDVLLGNNIYSSYSQNIQLIANGVVIPGYNNQSTGAKLSSTEGNYLQRKVGFYAQANIDYNRMFILSLTGRYDGSSVLSKTKSFYPYGSAAGSFIFTQLMQPSRILSFGKVRLSYALVGNDGIPPYYLNTPFVRAERATGLSANPFPYNDRPGFLQATTVGNPNLQNETLREYEGGVEARFFNNRITFEGSYFYRKSFNGIISDVPISNATGYSATTINSAEIENRGIEIVLSGSAIKTKNFSWDATLNFTRIRNKVLKIQDGVNELGRLTVGQPYNIFKGQADKYNAQGQLMIDDNGLPLRTDNVIIGDVNPDWLAGFNNNFQYKQFNLSFFVDMKKGGDVQNDVEGAAIFNGTSIHTVNRDNMVVQGIRESDGQANKTSITAQQYWQSRPLSATIQDGTFIKLRTVSIGYNVKSSVLAGTPFKGASLIVTGRNLWIHSPNFTGGDPEASSYGSGNSTQGVYAFSTPTTRAFNFSLKLTF